MRGKITMLNYIQLNHGVLNLPKIDMDLISHYLSKCKKPCPEAMEFIARSIPINRVNVHTLLKHHALTVAALYSLMNRIPDKHMHDYNSEGYLPALPELRKPYIGRVAKAIGVSELCDIFKFIYPKLSKVKLSDLKCVLFHLDGHYLDDSSLLYYLHNDTDYAHICDIYKQLPEHIHQLEYIIPKLRPDTPQIESILITLIQAGFDVKTLTKHSVRSGMNPITLNTAFLLVYLHGIGGVSNRDINTFSVPNYHLWSNNYNETDSPEYRKICGKISDHIRLKYNLAYQLD